MKADVIQSLGTGDPRRAVQAIDDMLHITEVVRHDPFIVSHLVRRRDHDQALGLLELVLKHAALDAKQRRELDTTLGGIETTLRFRQAMLAERAMVVTIIGTAGTDEFAQMLRWMATNRPTGAVQDWIWQVRDSAQSRWWGSFAHRPRLFQEKTYALRTLGRLADLVDVPGPAATRRWDNTWAGIKRDLKDYPINALVLPWLGGVRGPGLQLRQRLIAARLALRVDRFRREHGKLPETLDAVLDERIKAIPLGLISGRPLSYKPTPEGVRIFDTDPKDGKAVGEFKVSYGK